jgi:hypothetical protein
MTDAATIRIASWPDPVPQAQAAAWQRLVDVLVTAATAACCEKHVYTGLGEVVGGLMLLHPDQEYLPQRLENFLQQLMKTVGGGAEVHVVRFGEDEETVH